MNVEFAYRIAGLYIDIFRTQGYEAATEYLDRLLGNDAARRKEIAKAVQALQGIGDNKNDK